MSNIISSNSGTDNFSKALILEFVLYGLIVWNAMADAVETVSSLFLLSFGVLLYMIYERRIVFKNSTLLLSIIVLSFFNVIISCIVHSVSINIPTAVNYLSFIATLSYLWLMCKTRMTEKAGLIVLSLGVIVAALYPLAIRVRGFSVDGSYFTMGFSNANLTGMFIFQGILYCITGLFVYNKKILKLLCAAIIAMDFPLLLATQARNCVIALILMLFLVVYQLLRRKTIIAKWIIVFVVLFPILFVWIYLGLGDSLGFIEEQDNFFSNDGKNIGSRVQIWTTLLNQFKDNFLIGDYIALGGNAHNSHLVVLCSFGIVVFFLFLIFLYRVFLISKENVSSIQQSICLIAFMGTIFMGNAEGALFCGAIGLYIPACTYIGLANINWSQNEKKYHKK